MKNTITNATIEAAIKRFWDFIKGLRMDDHSKELNLWIRWTGRVTEIGNTDTYGTYFIHKYEDETITPNDLKDYFDSQNISSISNVNYDKNKEYITSFDVCVPKNISLYAPDEKVTDTMLASFTYYYQKDEHKPVYSRLDNPDRYPEKLDWNSGRITVHCYVAQNPMFYVKKKIKEEVEKITPKFIEMGKIAYKDEEIFNQKFEQFQKQTKADLFLRGWVMQKTMKNWERILKRMPQWKMGDIMMDSYEVYGLND